MSVVRNVRLIDRMQGEMLLNKTQMRLELETPFFHVDRWITRGELVTRLARNRFVDTRYIAIPNEEPIVGEYETALRLSPKYNVLQPDLVALKLAGRSHTLPLPDSITRDALLDGRLPIVRATFYSSSESDNHIRSLKLNPTSIDDGYSSLANAEHAAAHRVVDDPSTIVGVLRLTDTRYAIADLDLPKEVAELGVGIGGTEGRFSVRFSRITNAAESIVAFDGIQRLEP